MLFTGYFKCKWPGHNTYEDINAVFAPGYNVIEAPDEVPTGSHQAFGRHIAEVWDAGLGKFVFEFYSHAALDNDIASLEPDRQRVEIKTYGNSPANLIGTLGETIRYQWRFKLPTGFQPSSNFTHIMQIKAVDGDDSKPLFALTPRKGTPNQLEFNYGKDSITSTTYATADLSLFENTWIEATQIIKVGAAGIYSIELKRISDGAVLLAYNNANIATIRPDNSFIRPKWGIYRSLLDVASLRDEAVRFSYFSITEGVSFGETGDYRSIANGTANWSALSTWQVRNASGNWATPSTIPSTNNNVFIQSGDSIIVDVTASCKDLYFNQDIPASGKLGIGANIIQVSGKLRAYTGTKVLGTTDNVFYSTQVGDTTNFSNTAAVSTTGAIRFVGGTRTVFINGAWGPSGFTNCALEFNLNSGAVATIDASIKFKSITIANGTTVNATIVGGIGADNGAIPNLGSVTIKTGSKLITSRYGINNQVIFGLPTSKFGSIIIETGATVELTGVDPAIDATSIINNGTVLYTKSGTQNLLKKGLDITSVNPNNYFDIKLQNSGTKQMPDVNISIANALYLEGTAGFSNSTFTSTKAVMANGATIYRNGTGSINSTVIGFGSLTSDLVNVTINASNSTSGELIFSPLPGKTSTLSIANGVSYTITSNRSITNLSLNNNGLLILSPSSTITLTINGLITGTGNIYSTANCSLEMNGTGANQPLQFALGGRVLKDLTLNTNVVATLGTPLEITAGIAPGTVTVASGATLNSAGNLILKSDILGTARVDNSAGTISGDVTVERYIPANANRGWRLLSVPTITTQSIKTSWQTGTWITSKLPTAIADGYDAQSNSNSLLSYNSSSNSWVGVTTNTNTTSITTNGGYMLFVRGDRTATNLYSIITPTVLSTKGPLKQGTFPAAAIVVNANKFEVIGNPYASAIDLRNVARTGGTDAVFYVWDPKLLGSYNIGAMQTLTYNGSNYKITPGGGSYGVSGSTMNTIQSGQAFLAHATGSNGTIQFTEAAKVAGSSNVFRPFAPLQEQLVTNLYAINGTTGELADGTLNMYSNDFTNEVNGADAKKLANFGENFGMNREGQLLVVELREPIGIADTIFYNTAKLKLRAYQIELIADNLDHPNLLCKLIDRYFNDSIIVNLNGTSWYNFTVNGDTASSSASRFKLVFYQSGEIPVNQFSLSASQDNRVVVLNWKVGNQINVKGYEVEWSKDNIHFTKVNAQAARGRNGESLQYDWMDPADPGDNFYRVKMIDKNSGSRYSNVVKQPVKAAAPSIHIFPNIITNRDLNLQFTDMEKGVYSMRLLNALGQVIMMNTIQHNGGTYLHTKALAGNSSKGSYRLEIIQPGNKKTILKIFLAY